LKVSFQKKIFKHGVLNIQNSKVFLKKAYFRVLGNGEMLINPYIKPFKNSLGYISVGKKTKNK